MPNGTFSLSNTSAQDEADVRGLRFEVNGETVVVTRIAGSSSTSRTVTRDDARRMWVGARSAGSVARP